MASLRTKLCVLLTTLLATLSVTGQGKTSKQDLRDASAELAELYRADQAEQELAERLQARLERVTALVTQGLLSTPRDYHHAGWLLQHGEGADDFLMAHILSSIAALEQFQEAYFLSAAALDRFAQNVGMLQRFGSQTYDEAGKDLGDTSELLSDAIVAIYRAGSSGLTGNPIQPDARSSSKSVTAAEKFLRREVKVAKRRSKAEDDKTAASWQSSIQRTKSYVAAGSLKSARSYYDAGVILSFTDDKDSLLLAHILATTAGVLKHKQARPLFVDTLDSLLGVLDRAPVFDDVRGAGEDAAEVAPILRLHPRVRGRVMGKSR